MAEHNAYQSIIAADLGSTLTHACLIDKVDGVYRLVAKAESPTTWTEPENDISVGLYRAVKRLEQITQRSLLDDNDEILTPEQPLGQGVDAVVACANAAPPLQCVVVGLTDNLSVESAQRACAAANAVVTHVISLSSRLRRWDDETVDALLRRPPDVLVMVGGTDTSPVEGLESMARVLAILFEDVAAERRPVVVFAGNQEARRPVSAILSAVFDFRVVDNVRPTVRVESLGELQRELADIYEQVKLATLPGYRRLRQWSVAPVLATMRALSHTLRFLCQRDDLPQGILGVDIGGTNTYIGVSHGSLYQWAIGANLGTSFGAAGLLEQTPVASLQRWLPYAASDDEVLSNLQNAHLRPHSIPQTIEDLLLLHAASREAMALTMQRMWRQYWQGDSLAAEPGTASTPPFDVIAARGGVLANTPQDGLVALTLIDALQPTGMARLVMDWAGLWPALGVLASVQPLAAAQVLRYDGFRELGTLIAPVGEARVGENALHLKMTHRDGAKVELDVPAGSLQVLPLALDEQAMIEVRPSARFDIGLGRKGYGGRAWVRGGTLGLIVDTRGRPLPVPQDLATAQRWVANHLVSLGYDVHSTS